MERRTFVALVSGGLLTAALAAEAQQTGKVYRVGVLSPFSSSFGPGPSFEAFRQTLRNHEYSEAGGLMTYGPNLVDNFRRAATYVDKILKGAKAGELPFEEPTRYHLVVNRKTAMALGLTIPQALLGQAAEVIQ